MLAVLALAFSIFTLIVRALPLPNNIALFIAVGSPYAIVVAVAGSLPSVASCRVVMSVIALAIVAANCPAALVLLREAPRRR